MATLQSQYDRLLAEGRLVLLCDALNEMPRKAADGRDLVAEVRDYLRDKPHWVVSCRVRDYQEDLSSLTGVGKVRLKPLDPPRIKQVIDKRFAHAPQRGAALWAEMRGTDKLLQAWGFLDQAGQPEAFWGREWPENVKSEGKQYRFETPGFNDWQNLQRDLRRMLPLCRNPYMLFLVGEIFELKNSLPPNRGELFATFVDDLLAREEEACKATGAAWIEAGKIRTALSKLAYAMQISESGTEITRAEAEKLLSDNAVGTRSIVSLQTPNAPHGDVNLLLRLAASASLLDVGETIRFTHQLLQEYFASEVMGSAMDTGQSADWFWPAANWWQPQGWEETALILAGVRGDPQAVARWIAPAQPDMAFRVLSESGIEIDLAKIADSTRAALLESASAKVTEANPVGRAAAYRVLGVFDADQRPSIGLRPDAVPDILWCEVPPGEYPIGGDGYDALEAQKFEVKQAYRISRYPITYHQFQVFLDAPDGFYNPDWWEGPAADDDHKHQPGEQRYKFWNHPRERVSWWDATAFCRWLSVMVGYEVRLPTEQEWEAAARGKEGLVYPYGNEYDAAKANTSDTGIGETSAVGIFPEGASPFGVEDMSGNVWEWCLNEDERPDQMDIGGQSARVLRGGSFGDFRGYARAAYRDFGDPFARASFLGFRVVCRPPS